MFGLEVSDGRFDGGAAFHPFPNSFGDRSPAAFIDDDRLRALTRKEVSSSPFLKDQTPSEEVMWRLFAAGCLNGIHNQLDPKDVLLDLDPQAVEQMRPNYMALSKQFSGREPLLKLLLRGAQILEAGQELADISEERAGEALARTEVREMAKAS